MFPHLLFSPLKNISIIIIQFLCLFLSHNSVLIPLILFLKNKIIHLYFCHSDFPILTKKKKKIQTNSQKLWAPRSPPLPTSEPHEPKAIYYTKVIKPKHWGYSCNLTFSSHQKKKMENTKLYKICRMIFFPERRMACRVGNVLENTRSLSHLHSFLGS